MRKVYTFKGQILHVETTDFIPRIGDTLCLRELFYQVDHVLYDLQDPHEITILLKKEEHFQLLRVTVNKKDLTELKRLYKKAAPGSTFMFKGESVLEDYAKHLIEYLETKLPK